MLTTSRSYGNSRDIKFKSIPLLGLLIAINSATAIDYGAYRSDALPQGIHRQTSITTRNILEQLKRRNETSKPTLQDGTEHLLQYGALLRIQILDTIGKLVYDHYDDFGMREIEALYRIYSETLERKYNIFDIVPGVLDDPDIRPTKICAHINQHVMSCLKESSQVCMGIRIHDEANGNKEESGVHNLTRRIYRLAKISVNYPKGFSLRRVLHHLRGGRLRLTASLFSGLLHNVQYDNFDDKVRTAERDVLAYLRKPSANPITKKLEISYRRAEKVSELLKNYLTAASTMLKGRIADQAIYLSKHVTREIDAVSQNIELLGTVYDNSTINLKYLFELVLPNDTVPPDVLAARDFLLRQLEAKRIVETYLSIEKYQQNGPDQLLLEILGQLRDMGYAEDLATSLYVHALYWHKSHMIERVNELLELFDAYENLRNLKNYAGFMNIIQMIKNNLQGSNNVTIELLCTRPRECLRIGLEMLSTCSIMDEPTRRAIVLFIERTTYGCSNLKEDDAFVVASGESESNQGQFDDQMQITMSDDVVGIDDEYTKQDNSLNFTNVTEPTLEPNAVLTTTESTKITMSTTQRTEEQGSSETTTSLEPSTPEPKTTEFLVEETTEQQQQQSNNIEISDQAEQIDIPNQSKEIDVADQSKEIDIADQSKEIDIADQSKEIGIVDQSETSQQTSTTERPTVATTEKSCGYNCSSSECDKADCSVNIRATDCQGKDCNKTECADDDCRICNEAGNCTEIVCRDGECGSASAEIDDCEGEDCSVEICEGSDCSIETVTPETSTSPAKEILPEFEVAKCVGPECSENVTLASVNSTCQGADCSTESSEDTCEGSDCDLDESGQSEDCKDDECQENVVTEPCKGADCPTEAPTSTLKPCWGKNCSKGSKGCHGDGCTNLPTIADLPVEADATSTIPDLSTSTQPAILPLTYPTTICNNSDPQHQRKLNRLRKIRLIDALSSKAKSSYEVFDNLLAKNFEANVNDFERTDSEANIAENTGYPTDPPERIPDRIIVPGKKNLEMAEVETTVKDKNPEEGETMVTNLEETSGRDTRLVTANLQSTENPKEIVLRTTNLEETSRTTESPQQPGSPMSVDGPSGTVEKSENPRSQLMSLEETSETTKNQQKSDLQLTDLNITSVEKNLNEVRSRVTDREDTSETMKKVKKPNLEATNLEEMSEITEKPKEPESRVTELMQTNETRKHLLYPRLLVKKLPSIIMKKLKSGKTETSEKTILRSINHDRKAQNHEKENSSMTVLEGARNWSENLQKMLARKRKYREMFVKHLQNQGIFSHSNISDQQLREMSRGDEVLHETESSSQSGRKSLKRHHRVDNEDSPGEKSESVETTGKNKGKNRSNTGKQRAEMSKRTKLVSDDLDMDSISREVAEHGRSSRIRLKSSPKRWRWSTEKHQVRITSGDDLDHMDGLVPNTVESTGLSSRHYYKLREPVSESRNLQRAPEVQKISKSRYQVIGDADLYQIGENRLENQKSQDEEIGDAGPYQVTKKRLKNKKSQHKVIGNIYQIEDSRLKNRKPQGEEIGDAGLHQIGEKRLKNQKSQHQVIGDAGLYEIQETRLKSQKPQDEEIGDAGLYQIRENRLKNQKSEDEKIGDADLYQIREKRLKNKKSQHQVIGDTSLHQMREKRLKNQKLQDEEIGDAGLREIREKRLKNHKSQHQVIADADIYQMREKRLKNQKSQDEEIGDAGLYQIRENQFKNQKSQDEENGDAGLYQIRKKRLKNKKPHHQVISDADVYQIREKRLKNQKPQHQVIGAAGFYQVREKRLKNQNPQHRVINDGGLYQIREKWMKNQNTSDDASPIDHIIGKHRAKFYVIEGGEPILHKIEEYETKSDLIKGSESMLRKIREDQSKIRLAGNDDPELGDIGERETKIYMMKDGESSSDEHGIHQSKMFIVKDGDVALETIKKLESKIKEDEPGLGEIQNNRQIIYSTRDGKLMFDKIKPPPVNMYSDQEDNRMIDKTKKHQRRIHLEKGDDVTDRDIEYQPYIRQSGVRQTRKRDNEGNEEIIFRVRNDESKDHSRVRREPEMSPAYRRHMIKFPPRRQKS